MGSDSHRWRDFGDSGRRELTLAGVHSSGLLECSSTQGRTASKSRTLGCATTFKRGREKGSGLFTDQWGGRKE